MNKLIINGRFLSQRMTGIQRFAYEICCALRHIGANYVILAPQNICKDYYLDRLPLEIIGGKGSHFWEQVTLPRYVHKHYNGAILLSLSGLSPLFYNCNILTIHDISYLLRPRSYSWLYCTYYRIMTPLCARRARKILTVSQFSKDELVFYLRIEPDKIQVVYNAVRKKDVLPQEEGHNYLLAVASYAPRKNLKRLMQAYCTMNNPDFNLYLAGGINAVYADAELAQFKDKKGVHLLGYVQDKDLAQLYRNATAFINPSLYEGFGIPNVEAMQQDCPLIVSDIPAFKEVCSDAALYFNPLDISDMQTKIQEIMHNESLRQKLREAGKQQAAKFSWEQSAMVIKRIVEDL